MTFKLLIEVPDIPTREEAVRYQMLVSSLVAHAVTGVLEDCKDPEAQADMKRAVNIMSRMTVVAERRGPATEGL
jgi:hypothetical protein